MINFKSIGSTLILIIVLPLTNPAEAQMFSVGNNGTTYAPSTSALMIGVEPFNFEFQDDEEIFEGEAIDYTFNEAVYTLRFEIPGFEFYGGLGRDMESDDGSRINYLNAGIQLTGGMNIFTRQTFSVVLPMEINADYTQVVSDEQVNREQEFRQSAIMIGAGAAMEWRPTTRVRLSTRGVPLIGFSVSSHSGEGGAKYQFENRNRINLDHVFGRVGLMMGVDFKLTTLNSDEQQFRYDSNSYSLMLGITF